MKAKIWDKGQTKKDTKNAEVVEKFTVGKDTQFDLQLAKYDVIGSIAHAKMLNKIGLITNKELTAICKELNTILLQVENGKFKIEKGVEDIHSQIEFILTQKIGSAGKKIHTARSRNDQVLLDIKLFLKDEIKSIAKEVHSLFSQFLQLSTKYKKELLPGYTHFQLAMPSSFGLWFAAYAESLVDDLEILFAAYSICNKNPLGSGAGYGSSFPIDREMTTKLLNFETLNYNVVYAQMTRGKTEKIVSMALASIASTLSKFAYDVCLYMNQNFNFISFPESLTTGSSIMPHKKNPDVFELVRAKCNKIQALPNELTMLTNNLPSGYHRDWQLTKESLFPAIETLKECIAITGFMLKHIQIRKNILNDTKYNLLFSVEEVNKLVLEGYSFREAYKEVANQIQNVKFKPNKEITSSHIGSIGNLCNEKIKKRFTNIMTKLK